MDFHITLMLLPYWLILLSFLIWGGKGSDSELLVTDRLALSLQFIGGTCAITFILTFIGGTTLEFYVPDSFKLGVSYLLPMVFCGRILGKYKRSKNNINKFYTK
ncbi:hypothetical protein BTA51_28645 [Hahella sp. CCB-MM4]|nr:hypothetical protein BTA51_28645 [Hahella sp. CCB-MM4]